MAISGNEELSGMMEGLMAQQDDGPQTFEAEQIERLLSCSICLEVYTKPVVILPCQHNLCRKCANDCYTNRGTTMGTSGRFRCPTCRYEVVMDRHGVYGLQRNLLVENIIDMYNAADTRKATFKREEIMCPAHEDERVNIFCKTCQKPTCSLCKVFGTCTNCDVAPLGDVIEDHKTEINEGIANLVAGNDRLQAVIAQAKEVEKGTQDNANQTRNDLTSSFDTLFAILEERKASLLEKVTQETQKRIDKIKTDIQTFGKQLEDSSTLMNESIKLLEEKNQAKFLTQSRNTVEKMEETTEKLKVEAPSFDVTIMEDFKIDFAAAVESLKEINFNDPENEKRLGNANKSVQTMSEMTLESEVAPPEPEVKSPEVIFDSPSPQFNNSPWATPQSATYSGALEEKTKHVPAAKYRRYVKGRPEAARVPTPLPSMGVEIEPDDWNSDTDEDNIPAEASEMQHPIYQEGSSSERLNLDDLLPSGSPTSSSMVSVVQRQASDPTLPLPDTSNRNSPGGQKCSSRSSSPVPSHHGSDVSSVSDAGSNNTDRLLSSTLTNPYLVTRPTRRARELLYGSSRSRDNSPSRSPTRVPARTNYFRGWERPPPITVPDPTSTRRAPRRYGFGGRSYSFFN